VHPGRQLEVDSEERSVDDIVVIKRVLAAHCAQGGRRRCILASSFSSRYQVFEERQVIQGQPHLVEQVENGR